MGTDNTRDTAIAVALVLSMAALLIALVSVVADVGLAVLLNQPSIGSGLGRLAAGLGETWPR